MFVTFDIETTEDMKQPICAALAWREHGIIQQKVFYGDERQPMSQETIKQLVDEMLAYFSNGETIVSWNGLQFDFKVLHEAVENTNYKYAIKALAKYHVDLMFYIFCCKGWPVSQQNACMGSGLSGKVKRVKLSDGREVNDMNGAMAPMLWEAGEGFAVIEYLIGDVHSLLQLVETWDANHNARWLSKGGKHQFLDVDLDPNSPYFPTVEYCMNSPKPDVSWMDNPLKRETFYAWMGI